jgi:6-phosphogluconolactonase
LHAKNSRFRPSVIGAWDRGVPRRLFELRIVRKHNALRLCPRFANRRAQGAAGPDATVEYAYVVNNGDRSISAYKINATSGALTAVSGLFRTGADPTALALDPASDFVYAVNAGSDNISAYSIDVSTGALKKVAGSPFGTGRQPEGVAVDPTGKFAYVANAGSYFGSSGNIYAYKINAATGALTPVFGSPFTAGNGPIDVVVDPKGTFVYVTNQNSNNVSAFKINTTTGALKQVAGSPFASAYPIGLVVDPSGKFVYVTDGGVSSSGGGVWAYKINTTSGALSEVLGSPFAAGAQPASVVVGPTGKFAYVGNAGGATISAYQINTSSGALTQVKGSPFLGASTPYGVTVDPTGGFLYVANNSYNTGYGSVSGYQINATSGALTLVAGSPLAAGKSPFDIASCRVASGKCVPPPL